MAGAKPAAKKAPTAAQFVAAAKKRRRVTITIPELGGMAVTLRSLNTGEYDECVDLATTTDDMGHPSLDMDRLHQLTVIAAIEKPKLGPEDVAGIGEWDANVFARLLLAIRSLSNIQEGAADAAMSRFPDGAA